MQGIATVDRQPVGDNIVVWVTSRVEPLRAANSNAVSLDAATDSDAMEKVRSLTRECAVLATVGSVLDGLPIEGALLDLADVEALIAETEERQRAIVRAVREYKRRTKSAGIKEPTFPPSPRTTNFPRMTHADAIQRALASANFVAQAWTGWLETEEARRRRTFNPRSRTSPWMMPDELNSPDIAPLPPLLAARLHAGR